MSDAQKRAEMPKGKNSVLDRRTLVNSNANLLDVIKRGQRVLDVGCGSGTITRDIAMLTGASGSAVGIDTSEHLIAQARDTFGTVANLSFQLADINTFDDAEKFDVITSARVLQWLSNPVEVVDKMKTLLKPGGCLTVLDYNHEAVEFSPEIPSSMKKLYNAFLTWRKDAGMDNQIGDHLERIFHEAGLYDIVVKDYSEASIHGKPAFEEDLAIWKKVAEARGPQLVADGYLTEDERLTAVSDYDTWITRDAKYMRLILKAATGYLNS